MDPRPRLQFRKARKEDIPAIVGLLADDQLGQGRESMTDTAAEKYHRAFERIDEDGNQELVVVENDRNEIVGTLQLTFIQYLTYEGGLRAQVEAVRVRKEDRGTGTGTKIFEWAIQRARERRAHMLQLTTDKKRPEAIRFYKSLGFTDSHEGMKMHF